MYPELAKICARDRTPLIPFDPAFAPPVRQVPAPPPTYQQGSYSMGAKNMLVGAVTCLAGVAITIVSYGFASSGQGGGMYFVTYGAIVFGGWRFLRGLYQWSTGRDRVYYQTPSAVGRAAAPPDASANPHKQQDLY